MYWISKGPLDGERTFGLWIGNHGDPVTHLQGMGAGLVIILPSACQGSTSGFSSFVLCTYECMYECMCVCVLGKEQTRNLVYFKATFDFFLKLNINQRGSFTAGSEIYRSIGGMGLQTLGWFLSLSRLTLMHEGDIEYESLMDMGIWGSN